MHACRLTYRPGVDEPGNEKNSIVINQWYPLQGLKHSHHEKLSSGEVHIKAKLILKNVSKSGSLNDFYSYSEVVSTLHEIETNFEQMRTELEDALKRRDEELHKTYVIEQI